MKKIVVIFSLLSSLVFSAQQTSVVDGVTVDCTFNANEMWITNDSIRVLGESSTIITYNEATAYIYKSLSVTTVDNEGVLSIDSTVSSSKVFIDVPYSIDTVINPSQLLINLNQEIIYSGDTTSGLVDIYNFCITKIVTDLGPVISELKLWADSAPTVIWRKLE